MAIWFTTASGNSRIFPIRPRVAWLSTYYRRRGTLAYLEPLTEPRLPKRGRA